MFSKKFICVCIFTLVNDILFSNEMLMRLSLRIRKQSYHLHKYIIKYDYMSVTSKSK